MDAEKIAKRLIEQGPDAEKTARVIGQGGVFALLYFDLHADKKDTLQEFGAALVQKLLGIEGVVYAIGEIDEPVENKNLFSTSVEVKILVQNFSVLAGICGDFCPFSIEVLRPEKITITLDQAHTLLMNVSVNNYELKKTMLEKVYTKDDLEKFKKILEARLQIGKTILQKTE